ncbi:hypothetical protein CAI21_20740 [Alkalilimnicola ehrlichii]|uniref:HD-GYP domain-containing protein n=1 Tax=Alkalilimnicola ehrlichii TaxID=351052 RepID=A0A3E0WFU2_9GAMM|nr:HD domain-containing phosphohydrolase [Alkalilimnicola ehrlichii]RFA24716.1 hypothetical protein CAI21_20740 [Alkalilimnicola ehrlichii]RFA31814.1 hypothetical protein CAL65_21510 [Alkalilimnicola ehrlichii]
MDAHPEQRLEDQPQHYADHLSQVNATTEVVSIEDIYNDRGMLIARKGTRINESLSKKIRQHRLAKPLHSLVDINKGLTEQSVMDEFHKLWALFPDLKALLDGMEMEEDFEGMVLGVRLPRLILQNLTVLFHRKPHLFEQSLFVATLATLIVQALKRPPSEVRAAYLGGLVHDIGFLHIDPAILEKEDELTMAEWRAIQSHVIVSKLLVEEVGSAVPPLTNLAVIEHHERCDASGYPAFMSGARLHLLGQSIGISDGLYHLRTGLLDKLDLNLANAVPFLQMNSGTHFYENHKAVRILLTRARLKPETCNPFGSIAAFGAGVAKRSRALAGVIDVLLEVQSLASRTELKRGYACLARTPSRILRAVHASGVLGEAYLAWLENSLNDSEAGVQDELLNVYLMQEELLAQLRDFVQILNRYVMDEPETGVFVQVKDFSNKLQEHIAAVAEVY